MKCLALSAVLPKWGSLITVTSESGISSKAHNFVFAISHSVLPNIDGNRVESGI